MQFGKLILLILLITNEYYFIWLDFVYIGAKDYELWITPFPNINLILLNHKTLLSNNDNFENNCKQNP